MEGCFASDAIPPAAVGVLLPLPLGLVCGTDGGGGLLPLLPALLLAAPLAASLLLSFLVLPDAAAEADGGMALEISFLSSADTGGSKDALLPLGTIV